MITVVSDIHKCIWIFKRTCKYLILKLCSFKTISSDFSVIKTKPFFFLLLFTFNWKNWVFLSTNSQQIFFSEDYQTFLPKTDLQLKKKEFNCSILFANSRFLPLHPNSEVLYGKSQKYSPIFAKVDWMHFLNKLL